MNLISRDTDYAVRALVYLAKTNKKLVSTAELYEELKLPRPSIRKALQILKKKRILKSQRGSGGGFSLIKSPKKIALIDLMNIFQGKIEFSRCFFKRKLCPNREICPIRRKIKNIEKTALKDLSLITMQSLLENK
jgi:Rrf2 family protein